MTYRYPLAFLFASCGFVAQAETDSFTEMVVRDLIDNGYTQIEIERSDGELWAEGRGETGTIELVYDRDTGAILAKDISYEDDEDEDFGEIEIAIRDVDEDEEEYDDEYDEYDEDEDGDDEDWDEDEDDEDDDDDREDRDDDDEDGDDD